MRFDLQAGRDGRWLVIDGDRRFVVPATIGRQLGGPDGSTRWRALVAGAVSSGRRWRSLWLRLPILPARLVRLLSRPLALLARWDLMAAAVALGIAGSAAAPAPHVAGAADVLIAAGLFVASGLWHELGHAAALRREGWPPGAIGAGLLWVLPVLWSDVTATTLLRRAGRVRVDLAGVAFQAGFVGLVGLVSAAVDWLPAGLVVRASWLAIAWSLLPLVRSDGHWLVCDLLDLPSLTAPPPPTLGRRGRRVLAVWRWITLLAIAALVVLLGARLGAIGQACSLAASPLGRAALVASATLVVLGAVRAFRRIRKLLRAIRRDRSATR